MFCSIVYVTLIAILGLGSCAEIIAPELVITNADTTVDVSSQVVKIVSKISLENNGKSAIDYFLYSVQPKEVKHVSYVNAYLKNRQKKLKVSETKVKGYDIQFWRVNLPDTIKSGSKLDIVVETFLTNALTPLPAAINQIDKQLVVFSGNAVLYSPYAANKQSTSIVTGAKAVESATRLRQLTQSNGKVNYGPFENIAPLTVEEVSVHYENNAPFLTVTQLERVLEISHWGNIAIVESINLEHKGAALKGSFSRVDPLGPSSVKSFETVLPAAAKDVYYRDDIGNVSTSNLLILEDSVRVKLRPRFPLFGGWRTSYIIGYNIPTYESLYHTGELYVLKMRILDHVFDDMVVEDLTTKIILPEGATGIDVKTPYSVERLADERHSTYLDTVGRTVVVLHAKNLVENHIEDFEISYKYPAHSMLQKPFLLVMGVFSLLAVAVLVNRLDFSLSNNSSVGSKKLN